MDNNFYKLKINKVLTVIFLICFFMKAHVITALLNIFILDYLNILNSNIKLNDAHGPLPYYDLWDGFLQWIMMGTLLALFKINGFHKYLIPQINRI